MAGVGKTNFEGLVASKESKLGTKRGPTRQKKGAKKMATKIGKKGDVD